MMDRATLDTILSAHAKWLRGEAEGKRADLRGVNLYGADLQGAYLQGADLRDAYLYGADLQGANLRGADLRGAYLQGAYLQGVNLQGAYLQGADLQGVNLQGTLLETISWLAYIGICADEHGKARAYKMTKANGEGPLKGGINYAEGVEFEAKCHVDVNEHCGSGINLATFQWCLSERQEGYRLFLMEFEADKAVVPVGTDGKFRVPFCRKIGECDWTGRLKGVEKS